MAAFYDDFDVPELRFKGRVLTTSLELYGQCLLVLTVLSTQIGFQAWLSPQKAVLVYTNSTYEDMFCDEAMTVDTHHASQAHARGQKK